MVRRDCEPHRGALILIFGILSIVLPGTWVLAVIGLPLGIAAWVMGHRDLNKINAKAMDPQGKGITMAGYICGIIGTIISGLMGLVCVGYILLIIGIVSTASTMAPPPAPAPAAAPQTKKQAPMQRVPPPRRDAGFRGND
jgi:hypothetical protein